MTEAAELNNNQHSFVELLSAMISAKFKTDLPKEEEIFYKNIIE